MNLRLDTKTLKLWPYFIDHYTGGTKMQALGAAMRKLIQICFGVIKNQTRYQSALGLYSVPRDVIYKQLVEELIFIYNEMQPHLSFGVFQVSCRIKLNFMPPALLLFSLDLNLLH